MKQSILFSLVFLLISGCGLSTKTTPIQTRAAEIPRTPTASATNNPPTTTPPPLPNLIQTPTAISATIIFQDNFNGFLVK
ncbi:MAG: hypothetical protein NTW69_14390 [Chloroflexi bacterium]|nr:hypothetical protein [Chloroflexota bacterium]